MLSQVFRSYLAVITGAQYCAKTFSLTFSYIPSEIDLLVCVRGGTKKVVGGEAGALQPAKTLLFHLSFLAEAHVSPVLSQSAANSGIPDTLTPPQCRITSGIRGVNFDSRCI